MANIAVKDPQNPPPLPLKMIAEHGQLRAEIQAQYDKYALDDPSECENSSISQSSDAKAESDPVVNLANELHPGQQNLVNSNGRILVPPKRDRPQSDTFHDLKVARQIKISSSKVKKRGAGTQEEEMDVQHNTSRSK